jgi:hypothetical protein
VAPGVGRKARRWLVVSCHAQAQVLDERLKIPAGVQQVTRALDASGGNYRINGLANGHTGFAQCPEVSCRLNRNFLSA